MSARDDYPTNDDGWTITYRQYEKMCDEIDQLRTAYRSNLDLVLGLNDQIRELTKHADAMRDLLADARLRMSDLGDFHIRKQMIEAVHAYDQYVKEA